MIGQVNFPFQRALGIPGLRLRSQLFTATTTNWPAPAELLWVNGIGGGGGGAGGIVASGAGGGGGGGCGFGVHMMAYTCVVGDLLTISIPAVGTGGPAGSLGTAGGSAYISGSSIFTSHDSAGSDLSRVTFVGGSRGSLGSGTTGGNGGSSGQSFAGGG